MNLYDLIDHGLLKTMVKDGYIRVRPHPEVPGYQIFNYTEKAQYERMWNEATLNCRGLIVNGHEIIARPWMKFFNYGEYTQGKVVGSLDLEAAVEVTDKLDGSLGILYPLPDGTYAVATRGSFTSDQALHATKVWQERYASQFKPLAEFTYLFEIVYPENRIVLDYGKQDDLVFLGMRKHSTQYSNLLPVGTVVGPDNDYVWPGPRAKTFSYKTLVEALTAPIRKNAEGLVVRYLESGQMVKIKQDSYVELHRIVTGLSAKTVWEALMENRLQEILLSVPDEFHDWVNKTSTILLNRYQAVTESVNATMEIIMDELADQFGDYYEREFDIRDREGRKRFAEEANRPEYKDVRPFLFLKLDGKNTWDAIWKTLKPRGDTYMMNYSEDVA